VNSIVQKPHRIASHLVASARPAPPRVVRLSTVSAPVISDRRRRRLGGGVFALGRALSGASQTGKARPALSQNNGDDRCWKNGVELHCGWSRSFAAPSESSYRCAFASVYRHGMSPVTPRPLAAAFISIHQSPTYILSTQRCNLAFLQCPICELPTAMYTL